MFQQHALAREGIDGRRRNGPAVTTQIIRAQRIQRDHQDIRSARRGTTTEQISQRDQGDQRRISGKGELQRNLLAGKAIEGDNPWMRRLVAGSIFPRASRHLLAVHRHRKLSLCHGLAADLEQEIEPGLDGWHGDFLGQHAIRRQ